MGVLKHFWNTRKSPAQPTCGVEWRRGQNANNAETSGRALDFDRPVALLYPFAVGRAMHTVERTKQRNRRHWLCALARTSCDQGELTRRQHRARSAWRVVSADRLSWQLRLAVVLREDYTDQASLEAFWLLLASLASGQTQELANSRLAVEALRVHRGDENVVNKLCTPVVCQTHGALGTGQKKASKQADLFMYDQRWPVLA